jgi:hypothetical protein
VPERIICPSAEQKLLHEIMFKLGMLRGVLLMGTSLRRKFNARWLDVQALRSRVRCTAR